MSKIRKISLDHAHVRMRDDTASTIDHKGDTVIADLCRSHHALDRLETDLSDNDVPAHCCDGQGDVGLRLLAEIDRAHVSLVGAGLGELEVLTEVRLARELIHGKARGPNLLPAISVDMADRGDIRDLAKQAQEVQAVALEAAGRHRLRHPADLAFDLLDKVSQLLGDGLGLHTKDAVDQNANSGIG